MDPRLRLVTDSGGRDRSPVDALPFDAFFEGEAPALFSRMCLVTCNRSEAEEIVQDSFLALFERWDKIQTIDDPVGYLYVTAFNRWKRSSRRAARQLLVLTGIADRRNEFSGVDDRDLVDRGLAALTPRQRAAIVLTELLGYSSPEAAHVLGVRDVTVRTLASQGRATLRRVLEDGDD